MEMIIGFADCPWFDPEWTLEHPDFPLDPRVVEVGDSDAPERLSMRQATAVRRETTYRTTRGDVDEYSTNGYLTD